MGKGKKVSASNPVGSPSPQGDFRSPTVSKKFGGQLHGLGSPTEPFREPSVRGAHGFGHVAHMKKGHLRLSGYANAHRLGAHTVGKTKKVPEVG